MCGLSSASSPSKVAILAVALKNIFYLIRVFAPLVHDYYLPYFHDQHGIIGLQCNTLQSIICLVFPIIIEPFSGR